MYRNEGAITETSEKLSDDFSALHRGVCNTFQYIPREQTESSASLTISMVDGGSPTETEAFQKDLQSGGFGIIDPYESRHVTKSFQPHCSPMRHDELKQYDDTGMIDNVLDMRNDQNRTLMGREGVNSNSSRSDMYSMKEQAKSIRETANDKRVEVKQEIFHSKLGIFEKEDDDNMCVRNWIDTYGLKGLQRLLVDSMLVPQPRTINGSRLTSLAARAATLPSVPGVVYDPHGFQFLARFYESATSSTPTTKRFPLRRWGFYKSYRSACDCIQQAFKAGEFLEGEILPVFEVPKDQHSNLNTRAGSSQESPASNDFYVLPEFPDLFLPIVKGVSRDKKSRRWAVYYKGQRHYFYDKNFGGTPAAYEAAVQLRRQQVQEVELTHSEDISQTSSREKQHHLFPRYQALLLALLIDLKDSLKNVFLDYWSEEDKTESIECLSLHVSFVERVSTTSELEDYFYVFHECLQKGIFPSCLSNKKQFLLLEALLELQTRAVSDVLVQTGFWKLILGESKAT